MNIIEAIWEGFSAAASWLYAVVGFGGCSGIVVSFLLITRWVVRREKGNFLAVSSSMWFVWAALFGLAGMFAFYVIGMFVGRNNPAGTQLLCFGPLGVLIGGIVIAIAVIWTLVSSGLSTSLKRDNPYPPGSPENPDTDE